MSPFVRQILDRAKADKQTIVLPEGSDMRTLIAAETILREDVANLVIIGDAFELASVPYNLTGAYIIDNKTDGLREELAQSFYELRKHKGMTPEKALETMDDPIYFATMMVKNGYADGMVTGAVHPTAHVLRAALQILKTAPGTKFVSSFMVMVIKDKKYGDDGVMIFADIGLEIQPDAEKLAHIAVNSARSWQQLFGTEPRVAMLSHSTYGSANDPDQQKVTQAVGIANELAPDLMIDGEMQFDAAVVPSVAASKAPDSKVAGRANILIFPDLDAGNICKKAVKHFAHAEGYGPITQGIAYPVGDLSRGCTPDDIVGVIGIVCLQSQHKKQMERAAKEQEARQAQAQDAPEGAPAGKAAE